MISKEDVRRWGGKDIFDPAGEKIGTVEDFYLDKDTLDPEWVIVKRNFLGTGSKLLPYIAIDWRDDHVVACYDKDMVEDSPGPGVDGRLSDEEEYGLMEHYNLARSESTGKLVGMMGHPSQGQSDRHEMSLGESQRTTVDDSRQEQYRDRQVMEQPSDRRMMEQRAAAAHPFNTGFEEEERERDRQAESAPLGQGSDEMTQPSGTMATGNESDRPSSEPRGFEEFAPDQVEGSTRLVRVKKFMVTERVEQVPLSEEEFEEGGESDETRRAA